MEPEKQYPISTIRHKPWRRVRNTILRWVGNVVSWAFFLFILAAIIWQIPLVQNQVAQKVTNTLSEKLQAKVSIDYLYFGFLNRLTIKGFYVEDSQRDTLLYSELLKVDFVDNPIVFLKQGLIIDELSLINARLYLRKAENAKANNLEILLDRLFPKKQKPEKEREPFQINLKKLHLQQVVFQKEDKVRGQRLLAALSKGNIQIRELDLPGKKIHATSIDLTEPQLFIEEFPERPFPVETAVEIIDSSAANDTLSTQIVVDDFKMQGGKFSLHNFAKAPVKMTPADILDYQHMDVSDIEMNIRCFSFSDEVYQGEIVKMAFRESSGFELSALTAREASVSQRQLALYDFKIRTPYSEIGDTLIFRYKQLPDFEYFTDAVNMDARIHSAVIALSDIMVFAPGLEENTFFASNREEMIILDGEVRGRVNNLRGKDLNLRLSDGSTLQGDFSSRNLAVKNEEILNLSLERLGTRIETLKQLIPGYNLSSNFDRLGKINFRGSFDGFFEDFVAYGDLRSDIGRAILDMRMNLKNGKEKAGYSGKLTLESFDLGVWLNNRDFGLVNATSEVKDGRGLTGSTAKVQLIANIQNLSFKNYNYQNANLSGELNSNLFNGIFAIKDDNIDFSFTGLLNFKDSVPIFDFYADVNKLDLNKLNLSEKDVIVSGKVDLNLRNRQLSNFEGTINMENLNFLHNQKDNYKVDFFTARSYFDTSGTGNKIFNIDSDLIKGEIIGTFDIAQIPDVFLQYFGRNYPTFSKNLGLKASSKKVNDCKFNYNIEVVNSKGLNKIIDNKLGIIEHAVVEGFYDSAEDTIFLMAELPFLKYAGAELEDIGMFLRAKKEYGQMDALINSTVINEKTELKTIVFQNHLKGDTLDFAVNFSAGFQDNLSLDGTLFPKDSTLFQVYLKPLNLVILKDYWLIDPNNSIIIGKDYLNVENFSMTNRDRKISLQSYNEKGLLFSFFNVDFNYIDQYWDYESLDFGGKFDMVARVGNLFKMTDFNVELTSDSLAINDDPYGKFCIEANAKSLKSPVNAYLSIVSNAEQQLVAQGLFNLSDSGNPVDPKALEKQQHYFDFTVDIINYPICIAEYFIGNVVSQTEGVFSGRVRFEGLPAKPNMSGSLTLNDGALTVDYLKTRYTFDRGVVNVNNELFDMTGVMLKDKYGHLATVIGGIRHDRLRNFRLDVQLQTNRFLALDTQKGDNKLFYGHALGRGDIRFRGAFDKIDISINAIVGDSTHIVIPISSERSASELKFVRFKDKQKKEGGNNVNQIDLKGVSLEMELTVREQAKVDLVFNEQTGDIIKGLGRGNLRIVTTRDGNFQMYGDYTIEEGNYLFTLYNVINKSFRIRRGGFIQWTGDPFGARINLQAEYKGLTTSVANFIQEYLVNSPDDVKRDASKSTNVLLVMQLQGELLRPIINFDINFPLLAGELKNYTDSKLRLLKQDQNEMNRQVFGLIVVGQFLPSDLAFQGSEIFYNTVSEFVSNQLSMLLTELFSELIGDGRVLSGIDLDVAYNQYQSIDLSDGQDFNRGDEFQIQLKQNFFNDRLTVLVGGNIDLGASAQASAQTAGTFFGNDVVIEYVLSKDRSVKLRVYQRLQPDIGGRRLQVGTGLSFRKEFESFGEFWRSLRGELKNEK